MNRFINQSPANCYGKIARVVFAIILCSPLLSCQTSRREQNTQRYELKGKVVSVDKSRHEADIDHEEIPGYMQAMTMTFRFKDKDALNVMSKGDRVQAILVVADDGYWLENPVVSKAVASEAGSAAADDTVNVAEPETGTEVPDFSLVNQDGRRVRLSQYRARALLLTFIYTRCPLPEYCTLMSTNFAEINRKLEKEPALAQKAHLLSVTIDPAHDTPKVLKSYGAAHTEKYLEEKFERWEFATGDADEIKRMAAFFGLAYNKEKEEIVHALRTAIVAPDGRIYKIYRGNDWKPAEVLSDLRKLLGENASG